MSRPRRRISATTLAKQQRAWRNTERAMRMLLAEPTREFLVSNRTTAGTIHHGIARSLVRDGLAEYPQVDPDSDEFRMDMGRIRKRENPRWDRIGFVYTDDLT